MEQNQMTPLPKQLEEIKTYKNLSYLYYQTASLTTDFDVKLFHGLESKYSPVDLLQVTLDYCDIMLKDLESMAKALEFYTLKSNYSIVDEGRNYQVDYKCYELNEDTYADEELGTKAKEALKNYREKYK